MSDKTFDKLAGCGLLAAGLGVAMFLGATVRGMVMTKLWGWFIVPTFGLPALNIPQAIGLGLVVCFLRPVDLSDVQKKEDYSFVSSLLTDIVLTPLLILLFGRIVLAFM